MKHVIAIDIGGTNIKYALVRQDGAIVFESICKTRTETNGALYQLKTAIQASLDYVTRNNLKTVGIGIGVPSIVDDGVVLFANNLPEINNQNLKQIVEDSFCLPTFVDNDANLMGLGEFRYGKIGDASDIVFLTIGTGIGGALIINKQLWGGYRNKGTELGHMIIRYDGKPCSCGATGCLEAYASVTALIDDYNTELAKDNTSCLNTTKIDGKYIVAKYLEREALAVRVMENHFKYMATGIVGIINIFAPQRVILGGGISEAGDFYVDCITKLVMKQVMKETSEYVDIQSASLGNKAGFCGAAALVFENEQ